LRLNKVLSCLLESNIIFRPKIWNKELIKTFFISFSDRVSRDSFRNDLNDTTNIQSISCSVADCLVWKKLKFQVMSFKNLCEKSNYLKSQTILTNVIKYFKNTWDLSNLFTHIMILQEKFWYIVYFVLLSASFSRSVRGYTILFSKASLTQIHFNIIEWYFFVTIWPCRNIKFYTTFISALRMLLCVISRIICRISPSFNYACNHWNSLRMFFLLYFFEIILKLRILQIFFVFFSILKIFVRTFIFSALKCKQKWAFCSTLHRNSRISINAYNFKNRVDRKISRLRNNDFLYLSSNFLFFNIFGICGFHFSWYRSYLFIKVINLTEKYFFLFCKLPQNIFY